MKMGGVTCLCLVLAGMLCSVQAQTFKITKEFIDGNLKFTWPNVSTSRNYILITKDRNRGEWIQPTHDTYTVEDVWRYNSVTIKVREETNPGYTDYNSTYTMSRVESQEGESKNLTWTAEFFPKSGDYTIYHFGEDTSKTVMWVRNSGATAKKSSKYVYHTRPYNSTKIMLEIKNIELMDGGYYEGGGTQTVAKSGPGVVLVVRGKPTKPQITGLQNVIENSDVTLTCSSSSTSRPAYYSKTVFLTYIWYRNNTVMRAETQMRLRIYRISRDERFNKYSCSSKESIESEKSVETQIDVLYGPSNVTISPQLPVDKTLTVKDGDYIGPYHCSADCNPPCSIQWKYKLSNGTIGDPESDKETLLQQRVFKEQTLFRCVAKSSSGNSFPQIKILSPILLTITYLSKPVLMVNGKKEKSVNNQEGEYLNISCTVDGKPTPTLSINRHSQKSILKSVKTKSIEVLNRKVQCDDTDTYRCTASSAGFVNNYTEVTLNVNCNTRIDRGAGFKSNYGSRSGPGVTVNVRIPIISNPKPSTNSISWSGPMSPNIQNEIEGTDVIYKHWIISNIPIQDKRYFGNYTMIYNRQQMATITVKAEDIPKPPLNFTGYSYASGYINLTWISDFNGGPEQFFVLSRKAESGWIEVANITDPGEGTMGYYDPGFLNPGREYWYRLESCNRINCSSRPVEVKVTVLAPSNLSSSSGDTVIVIGISVALVVLIVALAVAVAIYFLKKKSNQQGQKRDKMSPTVKVDDSTQPDVVQYAVVDKSVIMKNRKQADLVTDDVIENKNDEQDNVYANTEESTLISKTGNKNRKKKGGKKTPQGGAEVTTETTYGNTGSRTVNQDGLIYVDVDFANKPGSSDTSGKPVIHGEEDRTEYTFVDFSKKAPPMPESEEDENTD